jgi:hypothetical protein
MWKAAKTQVRALKSRSSLTAVELAFGETD